MTFFFFLKTRKGPSARARERGKRKKEDKNGALSEA
jgi:hypothetical protein